MALNYTTCANAVVNALTAGQGLPGDMKDKMRDTWEKIIQQVFSHIVTNMEINVSIPNIPEGNFSATVTIGETPYPVTFNNSVAIPDETVSIS